MTEHEEDQNWWEDEAWYIVGVHSNPENPGYYPNGTANPPAQAALKLVCRRDPTVPESDDNAANVYVSPELVGGLGEKAAGLALGAWVEVRGKMFGPVMPDIWASAVKPCPELGIVPDVQAREDAIDIIYPEELPPPPPRPFIPRMG